MQATRVSLCQQTAAEEGCDQKDRAEIDRAMEIGN